MLVELLVWRVARPRMLPEPCMRHRPRACRDRRRLAMSASLATRRTPRLTRFLTPHNPRRLDGRWSADPRGVKTSPAQAERRLDQLPDLVQGPTWHWNFSAILLCQLLVSVIFTSVSPFVPLFL